MAFSFQSSPAFLFFILQLVECLLPELFQHAGETTKAVPDRADVCKVIAVVGQFFLAVGAQVIVLHLFSKSIESK